MNNGTDNNYDEMTHSAAFVGALRTTLNIFGKGLSDAFIRSRVISRYRDVCNKHCFIYLRYSFVKGHNTPVDSNGKTLDSKPRAEPGTHTAVIFICGCYMGGGPKSNKENMTQFDR